MFSLKWSLYFSFFVKCIVYTLFDQDEEDDKDIDVLCQVCKFILFLEIQKKDFHVKYIVFWMSAAVE